MTKSRNKAVTQAVAKSGPATWKAIMGLFTFHLHGSDANTKLLKEIKMSQENQTAAVEQVNAKLNALVAKVQKILAEVVALKDLPSGSAELDAAIAKLGVTAEALNAGLDQVDAVNPDPEQPAAGGGGEENTPR